MRIAVMDAKAGAFAYARLRCETAVYCVFNLITVTTGR